MAATDTFRHFNESLPKELPASVADLLRQNSEELLAARCEDARHRIVEAHIKEVNGRLEK